MCKYTEIWNCVYSNLMFEIFFSCLMWDNVEKYGTSVQTTADNIVQHMRSAYSVTSATDIHSPYATIISVVYMRVSYRNIRTTLSLWLKIREILSYTTRPTIHELLSFHSGINNLPFLLLYGTTMLSKSLQNFRKNFGV